MSALLDDLKAIVGDAGLLTGDDLRARPAGWLRSESMRGKAIVRPANTEQVGAVLALCNEARQPVVPLGGNTGLVDGTLSTEHDVLLSLERMQQIEAVDVAGATMSVQAGTPLQKVQQAAEEHGLMFALDLGARGSATIGGNIATNAGGNAVIRYGMAREQVLGLEAVLADGTVLTSMNRMLKNNAGYDLKQLFIGTEGTLGIVTRAVLRLRPALPARSTALVAVDAYAKVPRLLRLLGSRTGGTLSAFEVMWADFYETVVGNGRHTPALAPGAPFYVLLETRGGDQETDRAQLEAALAAALDESLITDAALAESGAQREALWAIRDDIDHLLSEFAPMMAFDVSLPISAADDYAQRVHAALKQRFAERYRATTFGHLGDGNLHFLLTIGSDDRDEQHAVMDIVYRELEAHGGSVSAEHGIGLEKRPFLHHSRSATEIQLMRRLKEALDPNGILNPGKIF